LEVFEIKYFLNLGVTLTEQGIDCLDYDEVLIMKYISLCEAKKMEENNNIGGNR
jgi:hypothetical protein